MGNDWDYEIEKGGRPKWGLILTLLTLLIIVLSLVRCGSETRISRPTTTPDTSVTVPRTVAPAVTAPVPSSKLSTHKPSPASLTIYVVSHVNSFWHVSDALAGWKMAKYTDFKLVETCPIDNPCVTVRLNKALPIDTAALTSFTTSPYVIYMDLNPAVTSPREAENTVSHEFGHVLGAPHIIGTIDTVMAPIGVYRVLPTRLDIRTVDAIGRWNSEKMYENSGKTLDMRRAPN